MRQELLRSEKPFSWLGEIPAAPVTGQLASLQLLPGSAISYGRRRNGTGPLVRNGSQPGRQVIAQFILEVPTTFATWSSETDTHLVGNRGYFTWPAATCKTRSQNRKHRDHNNLSKHLRTCLKTQNNSRKSQPCARDVSLNLPHVIRKTHSHFLLRNGSRSSSRSRPNTVPFGRSAFHRRGKKGTSARHLQPSRRNDFTAPKSTKRE